MRPCTFLILEFAASANSRSLKPPPSMAVGECTSMHIFNLRVLLAQNIDRRSITVNYCDVFQSLSLKNSVSNAYKDVRI